MYIFVNDGFVFLHNKRLKFSNFTSVLRKENLVNVAIRTGKFFSVFYCFLFSQNHKIFIKLCICFLSICKIVPFFFASTFIECNIYTSNGTNIIFKDCITDALIGIQTDITTILCLFCIPQSMLKMHFSNRVSY